MNLHAHATRRVRSCEIVDFNAFRVAENRGRHVAVEVHVYGSRRELFQHIDAGLKIGFLSFEDEFIVGR